jgi:hypothetical protein
VLRFECPRCQTVFTRDRGDDDAFVECPSCGALAMSAGEATGVDSDALARNLSSTHDIAALQNRLDATADGDAVAPGDSTQAPSGEGSEGGEGDDDRHNDDSGALSRPDMSDERPASGGIFNNLLGGIGDDDDLPAPPPVASAAARSPGAKAAGGGGLDLGLDDELGDFDLPVAQQKPAAPAKRSTPPRRAVREEAPAPSSQAPPPEVTASLGDDALGALEAAFDTLASAPVRPAPSGAGLSDDERRFLENVMGSASPPPPPPRPAKVAKPPPRPPEKPGVPRPAPPPLKKKAASTGFALSAEAREAAFIALKVKRPPPRVAPEPPPPPVRDDPEITAPNDVAPARRQRPSPAATAPEPTAPLVTDTDAEADAGGAARAKARAPRPRPTVWRDLHQGALAAAILAGLLVGAGAGAALAPSPQKRNDARARAELALADGNRYYEAARYDDALGKFKNAINNDRTYAPAHRAKGAALAKQAMMAAQTQQGEQAQKLWDEAASAYREYLALEPSAIDAADIKDALARRGVAPVTTGTSDG